MKTSARKIIDKFGGEDALAEALAVTRVTVFRWTYPKANGGTGGSIPDKYHSDILDAAGRNGIALEATDFVSDLILQKTSVVSGNQEGKAREAVADQDASVALRPVAGAGPP